MEYATMNYDDMGIVRMIAAPKEIRSLFFCPAIIEKRLPIVAFVVFAEMNWDGRGIYFAIAAKVVISKGIAYSKLCVEELVIHILDLSELGHMVLSDHP